MSRICLDDVSGFARVQINQGFGKLVLMRSQALDQALRGRDDQRRHHDSATSQSGYGSGALYCAVFAMVVWHGFCCSNYGKIFHLPSDGMYKLCAVFNEMRKPRGGTAIWSGDLATRGGDYPTGLPHDPGSTGLLFIGVHIASSRPSALRQSGPAWSCDVRRRTCFAALAHLRLPSDLVAGAV